MSVQQMNPALEALESVPVSEFVSVMGQHVASVCVITTRVDGEYFGLTATAVSSVCALPPRLLVCVNSSGYSHGRIVQAGHLCVNVVTDQQEKIAKAFSGMLGKDFDRFSLGEWTALRTGSPVLKNATAAFDCRISKAVTQFSHSIFICDVVATQACLAHDPLLYGARRFRTLRRITMPQAAPDVDIESLHF